MLFTVFLAICAQDVPTARCAESTAIQWVVAPEPQSMAVCGMYGQQLAAELQLLRSDRYLKVFCRPLGAPVDV
ncbi:hypothetical protein OCH239_18600 [Roseivivax halodurans JCM 10272]|uniref:Ribosomal protein S27 n=1 Tax=Roseivivax halodurans JCM 10272 TaxID=1449350 RepID=X7E9Z3_9RHOB|nr:hypothetical protein [Roseivivax halodurans]ETX12026.1 hypothetical protein OCH239_18600 [Roseivivax halodurans JCM 10272]